MKLYVDKELDLNPAKTQLAAEFTLFCAEHYQSTVTLKYILLQIETNTEYLRLLPIT